MKDVAALIDGVAAVAGKSPLRAALLLGRAFCAVWRCNRLAVRGGNQAGQADIDANRGTVTRRPLLVRQRDLEADEPLASRTGHNGGPDLDGGQLFRRHGRWSAACRYQAVH